MLSSQVSDTGQYVCKASNVAGQVDKNFHLNIYGELAGLLVAPSWGQFGDQFGYV